MSLLLAVVTICGIAYAYMFTRSEQMKNEFTPADVMCEVVESFNNTSGEKSSIKVENTGKIDAYIRVRLVSYWVDNKGNIVAKASEMPAVNITDDWIKDEAESTYYYKSTVAPGDLTKELLGDIMILKKDEVNGYYQVVEVFAEAIQSLPVDAVTNSWEVTLTDGCITAVN